jgi:hypothetical protein
LSRRKIDGLVSGWRAGFVILRALIGVARTAGKLSAKSGTDVTFDP